MRDRYCIAAIGIWGGAALLGGCGGSAPKANNGHSEKTIAEKIGETGDEITCTTLEKVSAAPLEDTRALSLWVVTADEKAWARIAAGNRLEAIGFRNANIAPEVFARLARLNSLRSLRLSECKIHQDAWAKLRESKVEELTFTGESIDDAAMEAIGSMPKLRWLLIGCGRDATGAVDRFAKTHSNIKLTLLSY